MRNYNIDLRYQVLDDILRHGGGTITEIKNKLNSRLPLEEIVISPKTIKKDIDNIMTLYSVEVVVSRDRGDQRNITYRYKDRSMSIYNMPFNDEDIAQLVQCLNILSRFEGLQDLDWMAKFTERFKKSLHLDTNPENIVGLDTNKYLKGLNHFAPLLSAISDHITLKIRYQSFKRPEPTELIIFPYYIKEFNKRWFLLGGTKGYGTISTWAFDRIMSIEEMPFEDYVPNPGYDFNDEYFSDMIGVTRRQGEPEKVRIWVSNQTAPYILTKPLHETQKRKGEDENGIELEIEVIPNFELEQLLLYYGEGVKVLSPQSLVDKMKAHAKKMTANYED